MPQTRNTRRSRGQRGGNSRHENEGYHPEEYMMTHGGWVMDNDYDYENRGSPEGRSRSGHHSPQMQGRDQYGQFNGHGGQRDPSNHANGGSNRWADYDNDSDHRGMITDSAGRHYSRESWERAQSGRARGGEHSHYRHSQNGSSEDAIGRWDDDGGYQQHAPVGHQGSGYRHNSGDNSRNNGWWSDRNDDNHYITDSAGRHYSRESWERAQEGRARGGQHSRSSGNGRRMQSSRR